MEVEEKKILETMAGDILTEMYRDRNHTVTNEAWENMVNPTTTEALSADTGINSTIEG
jgi:hypothetical protein